MAVHGVYLLAVVVGGAAAMRWHLIAFAVTTVVVAAVTEAALLRFLGKIAATAGARTQGG